MHRAHFLLPSLLVACEPPAPSLEDLRTVLVAPAGDNDLDRKIARVQGDIRAQRTVVDNLERLGRLYVARARQSSDPGYYKLAELCADGICKRAPAHAGGRLLRGHVLHGMHRFAQAEVVARDLLRDRADFAAHGLLGDVLYDRGDVHGALAHYQEMLDQRPCLQSYARAAQVRWLRGDFDSARQLLRLAVGAGSRRDPEALCWAYARLATLELQAGDLTAAATACARALEIDGESVGAHLAQARVLAARQDVENALRHAQRAADACPLPEHRWLLADLARQAGDTALAGQTETALRATGAQDDARHFALWLLARGLDPAQALRLAEGELRERQDVFSHDVHAWALLHVGRHAEADAAIQRALALDTDDPRLHYHAGAIAAARGAHRQARTHFAAAERRARALFPSERQDLRARSALVADK